ncbi:CHORD family protein, partial [Wuchereria bancrofti]
MAWQETFVAATTVSRGWEKKNCFIATIKDVVRSSILAITIMIHVCIILARHISTMLIKFGVVVIKKVRLQHMVKLKGCTRGQHSNQKAIAETKPEKLETKIKSQLSEEVIVWSGLNKPAARHDSLKIMKAIKFEVTDGALKGIERFKSEIKEAESDIHVGVSCKNTGCEKVYEGEESKDEKCMYHSGVAIFHEGMKYWSCCEKKTSDFGTFLEQKGCTTGQHCWTK